MSAVALVRPLHTPQPQISHPQPTNPINLPPSTKISQPPTIKTTNHQKRERDQQDWSGDDDGNDRSGLTHAACVSGDNSHLTLELII